jgi:SAM-dependent methyltransferase
MTPAAPAPAPASAPASAPAPAGDLTDYDRGWESLWDDMRRYGPTGRHSRRLVSAMVAGLDYDSVLDVGCGPGSLLELLRPLRPGAAYTGADFSAAAIEMARQRVPWAGFHALDLTQGALDRRFDLVLCTDVVEHIEDDVTAIANLAAMTGRYLLVATLQGRMPAFEKMVGHCRNYDHGELEGKLEAAGLVVERVVQWGFPFFSPLYRNLLDVLGGQGTQGHYGPARRVVAQVLYQLFRLNRHDRGDYLFVLARRPA